MSILFLIIAMSCDYQYTTQPAQRALSCSTLTAFVLQCQVVSNWSDFSITWHYSNYEPDSSNLYMHAATDIHDSRSTLITTTWDYSYNTTNGSLMISELRISEINEKNNINIDGYYWCSVNSSNDMNHTTTLNPSRVVHILHSIECTTKVDSICEDAVNFYSMFSKSESVPRCADQNVSVDVVEAQNCTTGDRIEPVTEQETSLYTNTEVTNALDIQNVSSKFIPTIITDSKVLPLTLGIIVGASMGGLILMLFIIIGLLLICMIRMKANKYRKAVNQVEVITPFDDIQMYNSVPVTDKSEIDEANRVSKMFLESNISYDCPQDIVSAPQTNENVYACIH